MTVTEAKRIISDSTHPQHERYRQNDPILVEQVNLAFQENFGSWDVEVTEITNRE